MIVKYTQSFYYIKCDNCSKQFSKEGQDYQTISQLRCAALKNKWTNPSIEYNSINYTGKKWYCPECSKENK